MPKERITQHIIQILTDHLVFFGPLDIQLEHDLLRDHGCDSLDRIKIASSIERELEITIDEHDFYHLTKVQHIRDYVLNKYIEKNK